MTSYGTILLTGGSGSFGRAFIKHLLAHDLAERIVSVSRNAEMRYRLEQDIPDPRLIVVPGDVRQRDDLEAAYAGPIDTIVHAAAEKHVGTGETHAHYVTSINVQGAKHVAAFAQQRRVTRLVALSTDKACRPFNHYGSSKLRAEGVFIDADQWPHSPTRCAVVRYGNVCGSSGSVLPLFIKQRQAGRLTVTDLRMTRYWMSLSPAADFTVFQEPGRRPVMSAVELVLFALDRMAGSEVFIPMIPSATIANLADELRGDAVVEEVGIRPGEKLHEELIAPEESGRCWRTEQGVYVLLPTVEARPSIPAERVPEGFTYTSADQPQPLRIELGVPA